MCFLDGIAVLAVFVDKDENLKSQQPALFNSRELNSRELNSRELNSRSKGRSVFRSAGHEERAIDSIIGGENRVCAISFGNCWNWKPGAFGKKTKR